MKVLVLGHKGMLGNCVYRYLSIYHNVVTTDHRFPSDKFKEYLSRYRGFIVNCIGAIPQKTDEFSVNYDLPVFLSTLTAKVIHPGTDCEGDDSPYGRSKKQASDHILSQSNTKILKASIIGLGSNHGLLGWFLSQDSVSGYTGAMWNGVTTLEWAKYCHILVKHWNMFEIETILCSDCISKHELLLTAARVFEKTINVTPVKKGENKCLQGVYTAPIYQQLKELRRFYE